MLRCVGHAHGLYLHPPKYVSGDAKDEIRRSTDEQHNTDAARRRFDPQSQPPNLVTAHPVRPPPPTPSHSTQSSVPSLEPLVEGVPG